MKKFKFSRILPDTALIMTIAMWFNDLKKLSIIPFVIFVISVIYLLLKKSNLN